jgi:hypothetical protein
MKGWRLLLVVLLLMPLAACAQADPYEADAYGNDRMGNHVMRFKHDGEGYNLYLLAIDLDIRKAGKYGGYEFALYLDDQLKARQEMNKFSFDLEDFSQEPVDLRYEIYFEDELVRTFLLENLMVYQGKEDQVFPLDTYKNAEALVMMGVDTLASVDYLNKLNYLFVSYSDLDHLGPVGNMEGLKTLVFERCHKIDDLSPLGKLSALESLVIIDCDQVSDVSSLVKAAKLQYIYLAACTGIREVGFLKDLEDLVYVDVFGSYNIQDLDVLEAGTTAEIHT